MYINEYSMIVNLYNWITDSCADTPINFEQKNDFFTSSSVSNYKEDLYMYSINQLIGYNYIYNYMYNLQTYINRIDREFSLSNYKNAYELSKYTECIEDIDLLVFMDWFLDEGIIKICDFIEGLEAASYKDEDMYNIMRYYNYIIDNSIKNESDTILTFLTEGSTEVFSKLSNYVCVSVTFDEMTFSDIIDSNKKVANNLSVSEELDNQKIECNNLKELMSAYGMQTSFLCKMEG